MCTCSIRMFLQNAESTKNATGFNVSFLECNGVPKFCRVEPFVWFSTVWITVLFTSFSQNIYSIYIWILQTELIFSFELHMSNIPKHENLVACNYFLYYFHWDCFGITMALPECCPCQRNTLPQHILYLGIFKDLIRHDFSENAHYN